MRSRKLWIWLTTALITLTGGVAYAALLPDSAPSRGYCIKVGTGEIRNLWLGSDGKCPTYSATDAYWGPVTFGSGAQGPQGPQGPKGDPGNSNMKVVSATVPMTSTSVAQVVTLVGLPAKSATEVEIAVNNAGESPIGTSVSVVAQSVPNGSTERTFKVTPTGFVPGQTFNLVIKVLAAD